MLTHKDLDHDTLWSLSYNKNAFTFIDFIKGIIPSFIFYNVQISVVTQLIISIFLNNIYLDIITQIWKLRCEEVICKEQHLNINKRTKKKRNHQEL